MNVIVKFVVVHKEGRTFSTFKNSQCCKESQKLWKLTFLIVEISSHSIYNWIYSLLCTLFAWIVVYNWVWRMSRFISNQIINRMLRRRIWRSGCCIKQCEFTESVFRCCCMNHIDLSLLIDWLSICIVTITLNVDYSI